MTSCLGIDTSNYTTSAAVYRTDGTGCNSSRLLNVEHGGMGLRQSAALFQHVKRLPERFEELQKAGLLTELAAVGASTRPRAVEGSYMPCFLAGTSQGQVLAETLQVPFTPSPISRGILRRPAGRRDGWSCWTNPLWHGTSPAAPRNCCWWFRKKGMCGPPGSAAPLIWLPVS